MIVRSHKFKNYFLLAAKVLILGVTLFYIYAKVSQLEEHVVTGVLEALHSKQIGYLLLFVVLAVINWVLEIFKWQTVISPVKKISFHEAARQTLGSFTVSLATPNRLGEYGAKVCYYPKQEWKKVAMLNFVGSSGQMFITLISGVIGLYFLMMNYQISLSTVKITFLIVIAFGALITAYFFRAKKWFIKGLSIIRVVRYIDQLDNKVKFKVLLLSTLRYVCFSYLFIELLWFFGSDISLREGYPLILSMYLFTSLIPTIFIFDVVVKGGVALWLFSLAGVPDIAVISTVMVMWLLNYLGPSLIGSFFVVTYKIPVTS